MKKLLLAAIAACAVAVLLADAIVLPRTVFRCERVEAVEAGWTNVPAGTNGWVVLRGAFHVELSPSDAHSLTNERPGCIVTPLLVACPPCRVVCTNGVLTCYDSTMSELIGTFTQEN